MDIHYNAFISYRHHPEDVKVAVDIHRGLERFKIPKALKAQGKAIERIFRDKEELTITSCLTDTITAALENSDFLIVICSPHTKESIWVQREIETFLRNHTRDHVLTVLAGGEPFDVIPDILLYEDVVNPITGLVERHEFEPLSCDWRLKKRKAVQEELPRLVAPLLDCGYDELRQRQRQYKMRRMATLFSLALAASLCLSAYFISTSIRIQKANDELFDANVQIQQSNEELNEANSQIQKANDELFDANIQIQDNLDQALRNQSAYLASSSGQSLEAGDRLTALALALAALPSEENHRPYVPEAEVALGQALHSYQPTPMVGVKGSFDAESMIRDYLLSEDAMTLCILDDRKLITLWDTQTMEKKHTLDLSGYEYIDEMYMTASGNLLLYVSTKTSVSMAVCYTPQGEILWSAEYVKDVIFLNGGTTVMLLQWDYANPERLIFLDTETGAEQQPALEIPKEEGAAVSYCYQTSYDPGQPITMRFSKGEVESVYLLDLQTREFTLLTQVDTSRQAGNLRVQVTRVDSDGDILLLLGDDSGMMNGDYGSFEVTSQARGQLLCYDSTTLEQKWASQIVTYVYSGIERVEPVPGKDQVVCIMGNTFQLHDGATGQVLNSCETAAKPMTVQVLENEIYGILQNGAYYSINMGNFQCTATPFTTNTLEGALAKKGYYVVFPLSTRVTKFHLVSDENAMKMEGANMSISARLAYEEQLAVVGSRTLTMVDMGQNTVRWQASLESYSPKLLGYSGEGSLLWLWDRTLVAYDCTTGELAQKIELDLTLPEAGDTSRESDLFCWRDQMLYLVEADGQMALRRLDLLTGALLPDVMLPDLAKETAKRSEGSRILAATATHVWIWKDQDLVYVIGLAEGTVRQIAQGITRRPDCTVSTSGTRILAALGSDLLLTSAAGDVITDISLGDLKGVSTCFYDRDLLVLADDGAVYRYDRQGNLLSKITLQIYDSFARSVTYLGDDPMAVYWWITDNGELILNAFQAGNIIETSQWQRRAFVPYMVAYDSQTDRLITRDSYQLYAFCRYTTQELLDQAEQMLGSFQLTDAQKRYYGIE